MTFYHKLSRNPTLQDLNLFFKSLFFLISIISIGAGTIFFIAYIYLNVQCDEVFLRGQSTFICGEDREKLKKNNYNFEWLKIYFYYQVLCFFSQVVSMGLALKLKKLVKSGLYSYILDRLSIKFDHISSGHIFAIKSESG